MAETAPEVSIVVPTQGERLSLIPALRSALAQDFPSLEVVVVDDSPTGNLGQRFPELANLLADARVRVVPFHEGRGCAAAKNAGWRAARGQWLCYLDDDNEYAPGKVSRQHALAVANGSPLVTCGLEIRAGPRHRLRQTAAADFSGDQLLLDVVADTNVIFHRRDVGVAWNERLGTVDDACLFQAIVEYYDLQTVPNVAEALVVYHAHAGARANRELLRFYRGQRHLLVRWTRRYSPRARRVLLLRSLIAFSKYRSGRWFELCRCSCALMRLAGWREWRVGVNALGVKTPILRRWMVT